MTTTTPVVFAPDTALLRRQVRAAWRAIDAEIDKPGGVGRVAEATERWSALYREWCAMTLERAYWGEDAS